MKFSELSNGDQFMLKEHEYLVMLKVNTIVAEDGFKSNATDIYAVDKHGARLPIPFEEQCPWFIKFDEEVILVNEGFVSPIQKQED